VSNPPAHIRAWRTDLQEYLGPKTASHPFVLVYGASVLPDFDTCYRALAARDPRFDGLFFVGIQTTGIYCRSICPARKPQPLSCRFFASAAAAEQAGFRPCMRCRPEIAPGNATTHSLEEAIFRKLQSRAPHGDSVEELAALTGFSSRQMRRLLKKTFGLAPIEILQTERLLFAKKLLQETDLSMLDVAVSAGFQSLRRFNALFLARYGLAPTALRKNRASGQRSSDDVLELRLAFRPPLAWRELLAWLRARATRGVETVFETGYARTVQIGEVRGWVEVQLLARDNALCLRAPAVVSPVLFPLVQHVREVFDLDANPEQIASHLRQDELLRPLVERHPGLRMPGAWNVFELGLRAILGQQVSVAAATTLTGRLAAHFGTPLDASRHGLTHLAPTPERLSALEPRKLAEIGLPLARAQTLRAWARHAASGLLHFPPGTPLETAVRRLREISGVGEWTAHYVALRALRYPDAFPAADLGLRKAAGLDRPQDLVARSLAWRPWRAYAAMHLWQSLSDSTHANSPLSL
jgi:AraC family transcriptional regulator, regulatory protein of adaptative response / DNA-3-methyladenine glycosylase II